MKPRDWEEQIGPTCISLGAGFADADQHPSHPGLSHPTINTNAVLDLILLDTKSCSHEENVYAHVYGLSLL